VAVKWNKIKVLVAMAIGIGLVSGALRPLFLSEAAHAELAISLHHFIVGLDTGNIGIGAVLPNVLRYGRTLLLIWTCGMLPKTQFAALLLLYMRAMALGFSAAMMIAAFGGLGFGYALTLYGLQNLIIMPIYAYTAYYIINHRMALTVRPPESLGPIVKLMAIGIAGVFVASVVATYTSPILFVLLWR